MPLFIFMEIWKDIQGYEGIYQVSNLGRVKSFPKTRNIGKNLRHYPGMIRKLQINKNGYVYVELSDNKKPKLIRVHRLVAIAFIPNQENKNAVNHKDGNKSNNCLENLEWCTNSENRQHAYNIGLQKKGGAHHKAKKVINLVTGEKFDCIKDAAKSIGMIRQTLEDQLKGRRRNKTNFIYQTS